MADAQKPDATPSEESAALIERLKVIEDQPLDARAEAFTQLHDELRAIFEAGDAAPGA